MYDWLPKDKTPIEIFEILIKPAEDATTCKIVPHCIPHNVCFLMDATRLKSQNDWKSDDMGTWKNNGVQHLPFVLQDDNVYSADEIQSECGGESYTMKRIYYKNKSSPDVKKIVSILEGNVLLMNKIKDGLVAPFVDMLCTNNTFCKHIFTFFRRNSCYTAYSDTGPG